MTGYEHIEHTFAPVYDADSLVLILGTLPSVKSRENHFYYGHKQNRFWKVMARSVRGTGAGDHRGEKENAADPPYRHMGCDPELRY